MDSGSYPCLPKHLGSFQNLHVPKPSETIEAKHLREYFFFSKREYLLFLFLNKRTNQAELYDLMQSAYKLALRGTEPEPSSKPLPRAIQRGLQEKLFLVPSPT